jgi:hypothetical protein
MGLMIARGLFAAAAILAATAADASTLVQFTIGSYAMPNGSGVASGGSFNYWDLTYNGDGNTTVDGAALASGRGDLSDDFVAPAIWNLTENLAGSGPYVGWNVATSPDPEIEFSIIVTADGRTFWLREIRVHLDNSGAGGVRAPSAILVNGKPVNFVAPTLGTAGWVTLAGLGSNVGENGVKVQFMHDSEWVFVSEVQLFGVVPEPASWAMLIAGFGLVGAAMRKQRRRNGVPAH